MTTCKLYGEEFGYVLVDVKVNKTNVVLTPLEEKPLFTNGCIDCLWNEGKISVKLDNTGKHCLKCWMSNILTIYPYRQGIPYTLEGDNVKEIIDNIFEKCSIIK